MNACEIKIENNIPVVKTYPKLMQELLTYTNFDVIQSIDLYGITLLDEFKDLGIENPGLSNILGFIEQDYINDTTPLDAREKQLLLDQRYMRMARIWAENSYCERRKVGALLVKNQMIISDGYNGTPSGFENNCEDENNVSKPYVLHAEANAISKVARSHNSSDNATLSCICDSTRMGSSFMDHCAFRFA